MTKPPSPRFQINNKKRAGPAPKKQIQQRLSLIITPSHIILAEGSNGKVKTVNSPIPATAILDSGAPGSFLELTGIIRRLRSELGSKTKSVDISAPDSFFQYALQQIPNVPKEAKEELSAAALNRVSTDLNINPANHVVSTLPLEHQSTVLTTYGSHQSIVALVSAVAASGLTVLTVAPHAFNIARGIEIPTGQSALLHFEPNGSLLMTFDNGALTYLEELRNVDRQIMVAVQESNQVSAFEKIQSPENWELDDVVYAAQQSIQSAADHLASLGLGNIDTILLSGEITESALGKALASRLNNVTLALSDYPGNTPLIAGITSRNKPSKSNVDEVNLLTQSVSQTAQPKKKSNLISLLPALILAGSTAWAIGSYVMNSNANQELNAKKEELNQLEQYVGQQQRLQAENASMTRTLSLRDEISSNAVDWPKQLKRVIGNTPMENGQYAATYAYMKPDLGVPNVARFGKLNVRYIFDVTVIADSRTQMLHFIRAFDGAPYAIDVQRMEKTNLGTYRLTATIGMTP